MAKQKVVASAGSNITKAASTVKQTETIAGAGTVAAPVTFYNIIVTIF